MTCIVRVICLTDSYELALTNVYLITTFIILFDICIYTTKLLPVNAQLCKTSQILFKINHYKLVVDCIISR